MDEKSEKMRECQWSLEEIQGLMKAMADYQLGRLQLQVGESTLIIEGKKEASVVVSPLPPVQAEPAPAAPAAGGEPVSEEKSPLSMTGNVVKSPIVGTFYQSPAPDKKPFVTVGKDVKQGDVLFIIESMKLMNEVQSEFDGTVAEILVENGQSVEYGQPILRII